MGGPRAELRGDDAHDPSGALAQLSEACRQGPGRRRILILGFGNPGRCDDGLGPAFVERVSALGLPGVTCESDYQLSIEHAERVARHDVVVFADAAIDVAAGVAFSLCALQPAGGGSCFSHHLAPAAVLELAAACFDARPSGWLLGLRASDVDSFAEGLTPQAARCLDFAVDAIRGALGPIAGMAGCAASAGGLTRVDPAASSRASSFSGPQPKPPPLPRRRCGEPTSTETSVDGAQGCWQQPPQANSKAQPVS